MSMKFTTRLLDFIISIYILLTMNNITIFVICVFVLLSIYWIVYRILLLKIKKSEQYIIDIFLQKIAKIPAVIEVMRPYVVDQKSAFELITKLHSDWIIHEYWSIHSLMEQNARINDQYAFLMKLSMVIPDIQKSDYFLYIRDFVMSYDVLMRREIPKFNQFVKKWNMFIWIKNALLIGYFLPWNKKLEV